LASTLPASLAKSGEHHHAFEILKKCAASCEPEQATSSAVNQQAAVLAVDKALKVVLTAVTEEFGFAPRDVYDAIFNPVSIGPSSSTFPCPL